MMNGWGYPPPPVSRRHPFYFILYLGRIPIIKKTKKMKPPPPIRNAGIEKPHTAFWVGSLTTLLGQISCYYMLRSLSQKARRRRMVPYALKHLPGRPKKEYGNIRPLSLPQGGPCRRMVPYAFKLLPGRPQEAYGQGA